MTRIEDQAARAELQNAWAGVVKMRERMRLLTIASFSVGSPAAHATADVLQNLSLLLAFDVLGQTLRQLRREGRFSSKSRFAGDLMDDAKDALQWIDWAYLREGVRRRNAVAHDGQLFARGRCWRDIDAIEQQLKTWDVV